MRRTREIVIYPTKDLETGFRSYGFQGPEQSCMCERYIGTFGRFGDLFQVEVQVMDATEYGKGYKRILINCDPLTEDCRKKSRMVRDILQKTGINKRRIDAKALL